MSIENTAAQDRVLAPKPKLLLWLVIVIVTALLVVAVVWVYPHVAIWASADHSVSSDRLRFGTVSRDDLIRDVAVQGRVVAGVSPTLYATHTGTVTFEVSVGDQVEENQVLASLTVPKSPINLEREQAMYESNVNGRQSRRNSDRQKED